MRTNGAGATSGPRDLGRQRVAKLDEPGEVRLSDGRQSGRQEEGRCLHRVVAKCRLNPSKVHLLQDRCGQTCWKDEQLHDRVRPTLEGQWWQDSKLGFQVHFPVAVSAPRGIHPLGHRPLRRAKTPHAGNTPSASPIRPSYPQEAPVDVDAQCGQEVERRAVDSSRKRTTP